MFAMLNSAAPPLLTTLDSLVHTPVFYILRLYRQLSGKALVFSETKCPTAEAPGLLNLPQRKSLPLLDVSASIDAHRLTVFVINRDIGEDQAVDLEISNKVRCTGMCAHPTRDQFKVSLSAFLETIWMFFFYTLQGENR